MQFLLPRYIDDTTTHWKKSMDLFLVLTVAFCGYNKQFLFSGFLVIFLRLLVRFSNLWCPLLASAAVSSYASRHFNSNTSSLIPYMLGSPPLKTSFKQRIFTFTTSQWYSSPHFSWILCSGFPSYTDASSKVVHHFRSSTDMVFPPHTDWLTFILCTTPGCGYTFEISQEYPSSATQLWLSLVPICLPLLLHRQTWRTISGAAQVSVPPHLVVAYIDSMYNARSKEDLWLRTRFSEYNHRNNTPSTHMGATPNCYCEPKIYSHTNVILDHNWPASRSLSLNSTKSPASFRFTHRWLLPITSHLDFLYLCVVFLARIRTSWNGVWLLHSISAQILVLYVTYPPACLEIELLCRIRSNNMQPPPLSQNSVCAQHWKLYNTIDSAPAQIVRFRFSTQPCPVMSLRSKWLVTAQDVHFFYTRSHLSVLQNCALLFSTNFSLFLHFKDALHNLVI